MFWVATAPLSPTGHINVSPKGYEGTFNIVDRKTVWYEDLSGSGVETIAHVRENGRITIMFCAFEGPPRITRLFGRGTVHEFGTPEYESIISVDKRQPGSRSVIMLDVYKVSSSCGYAVPLYTFKAHRLKLKESFARKEDEDISASAHGEPPLPEKGLKYYWKLKNTQSLDGLPGVLVAPDSTRPFEKREGHVIQSDEEIVCISGTTKGWGLTLKSLAIGEVCDLKVLIAFSLGVGVSAAWMRFVRA